MLTVPFARHSHSARPQRAGVGPMARSRRLASQPALAGLLLCGLAAVALTQTIGVANRVVVTRAEIDTLRQEAVYLEADIGRLESEWNRLASRDAVLPRAERELGLRAPAQAAEVVVVTGADAPAGGAPAWARALDAVAGGGAVAAAVAQEGR